MAHERYTSNYALEDQNGYCRAVKAGNTVYVSGTTARGEDLQKDAAGQAEAIFQIIIPALERAGSRLEHVVRSVVYVTDFDQADAVGAVHGKYFGAIKPCLTLLEISRLIPHALVEIELTAVIPEE